MTNTLTDLRIACAKAVKKEIFTLPAYWNGAKDGVTIRQPDRSLHVWAPDLEGHEAQLVELIEFLRSKDAWFPWHTIIRPANDDWKLAIMRAVAEVADDNS